MLTSKQFYISWNASNFVPDVVYRFRLLNMNFDDFGGTVMRVSFSYNFCNSSVPELQPFALIGADSSLFSQSIDSQTSFVLSQAERMDFLIKFPPNFPHFSICTQDPTNPVPDTNFRQDDSLLGIKLGNSTAVDKNTRTSTANISLSVPFIDLSLETNIPVIRMRPLIFMGSTIFSIHGRTDFHQGWSENPMLGTVEDWFIINTIYFAHPIHIHLINFQIIREYDLRVITTPLQNQCSIYEMDFVI
jgi:FtsP/CotA-like multicopper oxidase with cupredoxin domain